MHTGQSDPIISRSGPKVSKATSRYGAICSGFQVRQSASVTNPESLQKTLLNFASALMPDFHGCNCCFLIGGLARWSRTKR